MSAQNGNDGHMTMRKDTVRVIAREPWLTVQEITVRLGLGRDKTTMGKLAMFQLALDELVASRIVVGVDGEHWRHYAMGGDCSNTAISKLAEWAKIEVTPPDWREPHMTAEDYYA